MPQPIQVNLYQKAVLLTTAMDDLFGIIFCAAKLQNYCKGERICWKDGIEIDILRSKLFKK